MSDQNFEEDSDIVVEEESDIVINEVPDEVEPEAPPEEIDIEEKPVQSQKEEQKPKNRAPAERRINEITREKYQAQEEARRASEELRRIREENEQLRKMAELSSHSAMVNYDSSLETRISQAKDMKKRAYESGDIDQQSEADFLLASLAAEKKTSEAWKIQKTFQDEQVKQQQAREQTQHQISQEEYLNRWVQHYSPLLDEKSPDYHPEAAQRMSEYIDSLDAELLRTNRQHLYRSYDYVNQLDNYMKSHILPSLNQDSQEDYQPETQLNSQRRAPVQTSRRNNVAPVNRQQSSGARNKPSYTITASEKEIASRMEVSDKEYVKWREKINAEQGPIRRQ